MDSSPLLEFLDQILEWIPRSGLELETRPHGSEIPRRRAKQLSVIRNYVSKLGVDSDLNLRTYTKWGLSKAWQQRYRLQTPRKVYRMIDSFVQDLDELFKIQKVPKLPYSDHDQFLKKNELPAAFISFLFQIQHTDRKPEFINSQLMDELRSLIVILGDTPFQAIEDEQVQNLWAVFEGLANEAGRLVHSFIVAPDRLSYDETMEASLSTLLESIDSFKGNIKTCLNLLPIVATSKPNCLVGSFFIVDSLACDLEGLMVRDDGGIVEIKDRIKMLHQELMSAQHSIKDDINVQHPLEIEELKEPAMEIRDVAYEAEYLINSFLVGDVPLWYLIVRLDHVIHNVKLIKTKLTEMKANYDTVALTFGQGSVHQSKRVMGTSKVDIDIIVGFEEHESNIVDQLVAERMDQRLQTIFIFGMAGVGKTTLAKMIYKHPRVTRHFDRRAWCTVSQVYRFKNLLVDILLCVDSGFDKKEVLEKDEDFISDRIYKTLINRRYLIVIDDIWNSKPWDDLHIFFPDQEIGSWILFTSRIKNAAPSSRIIYKLPILLDDQCWELLRKKLFGNEPCPPHLQGIGKKIAAKCYGLPLAVTAIVGVLSTKNKEESIWENVRRSLDSYLFIDQTSSIMQILKFSYEHLPQHLKPCFLLFGVFQEDTKIRVKKLTQLWIAEGFIPKVLSESAKRVAQEYLMELVDRGLVMIVEERSLGGAKACVIHDLLHDLCLKLVEEENFLTLLDRGDSLHSLNYQHLSVWINKWKPKECLVPYGPRFRSLFYTLSYGTTLSLLNMKLLRVLDFIGRVRRDSTFVGVDCNFVGVEFLLHLRYLATNILPNSIDRFVNLKILILHYIVSLSTKILNTLVKLRHLSSPAIHLDMDCDTMKTSELEFLSVVSIKNPEEEEKLKCFPHLHTLKCQYFESQSSWQELEREYCPNFGFLTKCEALTVYSSSRWPPEAVNVIEFPPNVRRLSVDGFKLSSERMSIVGVLSKLEVLKLVGVAFEGKTWETIDGEFQQLRYLKMEGIMYLSHWKISSAKHFPKLQRLSMMDCYELVKIPCEIGDLASLQVIEVGGWCQQSFVDSVREFEQEQLEMGYEEPKVFIKNVVICDEDDVFFSKSRYFPRV